MIRETRAIAVRCLTTIGLLGMLFAMTGCAAATLATAGSVAGIAATAVSTGADVYHLGKLDSAEMIRLPELIDAVHQTAIDMELTIISEKQEAPGKQYMVLRDDRGTEIGITLDRRAERLCFCRINVGLFGSEPIARLLLFRIRQHEPVPPEVRVKPTSMPAWPEDPRGPVIDDGHDSPERKSRR